MRFLLFLALSSCSPAPIELVTPDTADGATIQNQTAETLVHFEWREGSAVAAESDFDVAPGVSFSVRHPAGADLLVISSDENEWEFATFPLAVVSTQESQ